MGFQFKFYTNISKLNNQKYNFTNNVIVKRIKPQCQMNCDIEIDKFLGE